jgi:hypothetical protein
MYFLNYVDRNAIAQARLNDLEEDLGMTEDFQFNVCVSVCVPITYLAPHCPNHNSHITGSLSDTS